MSTPDLNALLDELHADIRGHVATGFIDADAIVEAVLDRHGDDADPAILRPHTQRFVREMMALRADAKRHRGAACRAGHLAGAHRLRSAGRRVYGARGGGDQLPPELLVLRCGSAEIWDEIAEAQEAGRPARGYAFYHVQDTQSAVEGYGLYLNYGAVEEGEAAALAVANEVVARLERHALRFSWDGRWSRLIGVSLDWKRRWRA
jgi:hypothetical protein